jgi:hypothetical protein
MGNKQGCNMIAFGDAPMVAQRRSGFVIAWLATMVLATPAAVLAQASPNQASGTTMTVISCASTGPERQHCAASIAAGVSLVRSTGAAACVFQETWGHDDSGVWVSDGCSGEFLVARDTSSAAATSPPANTAPLPAAAAAPQPEERSSFGAFDASGTGFLIGRNRFGELTIGGYALVRYINQLPAEQTFTDHLGNVKTIDTRNDVQFHRAMINLRGWFGNPKFRYQITAWSVMSTNQTTLYGFLGYQFHKKFNVYAGINSIGGSRSLMGSHPFWLANDRVMADEFFRPGFTGSAWINGEILPKFYYTVSVGNNLSQLGITSKQLTRDMGVGGGVWWMPTTGEFGPNGSYDDWEYHERVATRFGGSYAYSPEDRFNQNNNSSPDNTQVRLADSLLLFETGSLAPGVTVQRARYRNNSMDAGIKYHGIFLQAEYYNRWLDHFVTDGPVPNRQITDRGFYIQGAFYPIRKKLEVYGATSWVYGDKNAGFRTSHEFLEGVNYFPFNSRNYRVNGQVIHVDRSPASSSFGFYVGGQKGTTVSVATSIYF